MSIVITGDLDWSGDLILFLEALDGWPAADVAGYAFTSSGDIEYACSVPEPVDPDNRLLGLYRCVAKTVSGVIAGVGYVNIAAATTQVRMRSEEAVALDAATKKLLIPIVSPIKPWAGITDTAQIGGLPATDWSTPEDQYSGGDGAVGRTLILGGSKNRLRQSGYVTAASYRSGSFSFSNAPVKLMIFRFSGSVWSVVGQTALQSTQTADAVNSFTFQEPIAVQVGDYVGLFMARTPDRSNSIVAGIDANSSVIYSQGDFSDGGSAIGSESTDAGYNIWIQVTGFIPYLAITGDSIVEGHNAGSGNGWHGYMHGGEIGGNPKANPGEMLEEILGAGFYQQNHALGSTTFAWVRSTGVPACVASGARAIWIHCGVNDTETRTLQNILDDLDAIRVLVPWDTRLLITEILPYPGANDTDAALIRTWNTAITEWCEANQVERILCFDQFGALRSSTGELDNMKNKYAEGDDVHLSQMGVAKLAELAAYQLADETPFGAAIFKAIGDEVESRELMLNSTYDAAKTAASQASVDDIPTSVAVESDLMISTTIDAIIDSRTFTLVAGSTTNGVYDNQLIIITKHGSSIQKYRDIILHYDYNADVDSKTVILKSEPNFNITAGDSVSIIAIGSSLIQSDVISDQSESDHPLASNR